MTSNCIASVSIGCLFCFQRCDINKIQVAFTFLPPPASYDVEEGNNSGEGGKIVYVAEALKTFGFYVQAAQNATAYFVQTKRGERCPLVWIRPGAPSASRPPARDPPIVLLHCHGNATDIGMMMGPYFELAKQLGIEVVGVEYSGYGVSSGSPNAGRTYADVEAACDFVLAQGIPPENIVAYGQSVGSGPACYIASKHKLGGLILHSPLMSGIKVIDPQPDSCCRPSCVFSCCDFYPNDKRVRKATCPTFIIHGRLDDIVPFYHGSRLSEMTPAEHRWPGYFPARAGHNDIVESNVQGYFQELANFFQSGLNGSASASGGLQKKPMQVEMQPGVFGAQDNGGGGSALSYAEPTVGPEDGMYAGLRRERPASAPPPEPIGANL